MTDVTEQQQKELEDLYPKEEAREALHGLMAEIRPKRFFRIWSWGMKTQYFIGQLPTLIIAVFFIYVINPWTPKTVWSVALGVCLLVVSLFLFGFGMYVPPLKAARFRYLSCCFYMGGEPAVGLARELAVFPYVEPETPVQLDRISDQEIRTYLKMIREKLGEYYQRQRNRLNQLGVPVPSSKSTPPEENLGHFFATPVKPTIKQTIARFFKRPTFFTGIICFVIAYTYYQMLPLFFALGVPILDLFMMMIMAIIILTGFLFIIPWYMLRRSKPIIQVNPNEPETSN